MRVSLDRGRRAAVAIAASALLLGCVVTGLSPVAAKAATGSAVAAPLVGGSDFGANVLVLPNGNFVVVDPHWNTDVGAVYLYDGQNTNRLISTVTGSNAGDQVGFGVGGVGGVVAVGTSNFVIVSPNWANGNQTGAGAVTWVDGTSGLNQPVSAANSLVGTTTLDSVGVGGITVLANGNYVVSSPDWTNGGDLRTAFGAATLGNAATGTVGPVSKDNSLIGSAPGDRVSGGGVTVLTNGNYVVSSPDWSGTAASAGAATFGNGTTGVKDVLTNANSLVGSAPGDRVSGGGVAALTNGNYVVSSPLWDSAVPDAGAATWANGGSGISGAVATGNSLVGTTPSDHVGFDGVRALTNGNYVVISSVWDNGLVADAGAVTRGIGATGTTGAVTTGNSLFGTTTLDNVGSGGVTALTNGNYVVSSPNWNGEIGAATWGNGGSGISGAVTIGNSLFGTTALDNVGSGGVTALTNGNYVVSSPFWNHVGAASWGNGVTGIAGEVTAGDSLVGTAQDDNVGSGGVTALTNGNYVVSSPDWNSLVGAATWGNGGGGTVGPVALGNSLVGSNPGDHVGSINALLPGVTALTDGDYVVGSPAWSSNIGIVGAVAFGDGKVGVSGPVSALNSLVGGLDGDNVGSGGVTAFANGTYAVISPLFDNGGVANAGAVTIGRLGGTIGSITAQNSAFGTPVADGSIVEFVASRLTAGRAIVAATQQNQALLLQLDNVPPVLGALPAEMSVTAAFGTATRAVTFPIPTATDNEGVHSVVCDPASGSSFPIGVTKVTCTATDVSGLTVSASFTVTVTAGTDVQPPVLGAVPGTSSTKDYEPLAGARIADTRADGATTDSQFVGQGIRRSASTLELAVAGRGGVALDAVAVALNVTAVGATGNGYVTVYPCGSTLPTASNLNYTSGSVTPNAVIAKIGRDGKVCLFVSAATHLVVDVTGYFPTSTNLSSINPARVLETRAGLPTIDAQQQGVGALTGGSVTAVQITGRASVPNDASAVVLNVTVTEAHAPGFVTVYPCGATTPNASNINYVTGSTVANLIVSKIGDGGKVCIFTSAQTHLVVDVNGYFPLVTSYRSLVPARILDTRPAGSTFDGQFRGVGLRPTGTVTALTVTNRGPVPAAAGTVVLNVTVTEPTAPGYVTVYPCGIDTPLASNLNYDVGTTVANAVIVKVGTDGKVCLFNSRPTQLIVDVNGFMPV